MTGLAPQAAIWPPCVCPHSANSNFAIADRREAIGGMHEHDPRSPKRRPTPGRRAALHGDRVVQPADHDVAERVWQPDVSIFVRTRTPARSSSFDVGVIGVEIMVAEHGELAQWRWNLGQEGSDAFDVHSAHGHEIATEEEHVGLHSRERRTGVGENASVGHSAGVEVGGKADSEHGARPMCGCPLRAQRDFRRADAPLQP